MYLIAHQDTCQMVVGNVQEGVIQVRTDGSMNTNATIRLPRQCTCEPMTVWLVKHIPVDGNGDHNVQWIMPTTLP